MKRSLTKRSAEAINNRLAAVMAAPAPAVFDDWLVFHFGCIRDDTDPHQLDWKFDCSLTDFTRSCIFAFNNADRVLVNYSDTAVGIALDAILCGMHSDFANLFLKGELDFDLRWAFLESIESLYGKCLSVRCQPVLGHLNEGVGPLSALTYMLWDLSPLTGALSIRHPATQRSVLLEVFGRILRHRPINPACIESLLHGLGHMAGSDRQHHDEIVSTIDAALAETPLGRPELIEYAKRARYGCVL